MVLRPLPYQEPDRIVGIMNLWTRTGARGTNVSGPDFLDWKAQSQSFHRDGLLVGGEQSVTVKGTADYAMVFRVTPGFFDALGANVALGRLLSKEEQNPGAQAVVITDAFWKRQFNANPAALGSSVKFGDRMFTIVGVLERGIRFPARADIYSAAGTCQRRCRDRDTTIASSHA